LLSSFPNQRSNTYEEYHHSLLVAFSILSFTNLPAEADTHEVGEKIGNAVKSSTEFVKESYAKVKEGVNNTYEKSKKELNEDYYQTKQYIEDKYHSADECIDDNKKTLKEKSSEAYDSTKETATKYYNKAKTGSDEFTEGLSNGYKGE